MTRFLDSLRPRTGWWAVRLGGLIAVATALLARRSVRSHQVWTGRTPLTLLVLMAIVMVIAEIWGRHQRHPRRGAVLLAALAGLVATGWVLRGWIVSLLDSGFSVDSRLALAAVWAAVTVTVAADLALVSGRAHSPGPVRRRPALRIAGAAAAVVGPVLLIGAGAVGLRAGLDPVTQVLAAPTTAPAKLSSLAGTRRWTRTLSPAVLDAVAGARGPVVLAGDTVMGLNPADGSTLWSYRRAHARADQFSELTPHPSLIASPDGRHVAVVWIGPAAPEPHTSPRELTVLDTMTGRIVATRIFTGQEGVQMSDRVVWAGGEGISLANGSVLWDGAMVDRYHSRTAGRSSFIVGGTAHNPEATPASQDLRAYDLTIARDTDIADTRVLTGVVGDINTYAIPLVDGWTVRLVPGAPRDTRTGRLPLETVSIDTGRAARLPDSMGPDAGTSVQAIALRGTAGAGEDSKEHWTMPAVSEIGGDPARLVENRWPQPRKPPVAYYPTPDTGAVQVYRTLEGRPVARIERTTGAPAIDLPLPDGHPAYAERGALSTPGIVMVRVDAGDGATREDPTATVLVGVS